METMVYETPADSDAELVVYILVAAGNVRVISGIFHQCTNSVEIKVFWLICYVFSLSHT